MAQVSTTRSAAQVTPAPWRFAGFWTSLVLIIYILINVPRALLGPVAFAAYYGLPLGSPEATAFVAVYAVRALFLGAFGLALLLRRSYATLALFALIGTIMPVGDALLVAQYGGPTTIVLRHSLTAVFLLASWYLTRRMALRLAASEREPAHR